MRCHHGLRSDFDSGAAAKHTHTHSQPNIRNKASSTSSYLSVVLGGIEAASADGAILALQRIAATRSDKSEGRHQAAAAATHPFSVSVGLLPLPLSADADEDAEEETCAEQVSRITVTCGVCIAASWHNRKTKTSG